MNSKKLPVVACPQCGSDVIWCSETSPYRPFCSERCKLIDLGQWASENYRVALAEDATDELQEPDHQA